MTRLLARIEARSLLVLLALAVLLWGFAALASEMVEGDIHAFDEALLLALRTPGDLADPIGPVWMETVMRDITALGGVVILLVLVLASIAVLVMKGQPRSAVLLVVAVAGGQALSSSIKVVFGRPRPDLVPWGTDALTASFPSGHAMMAAATWLTLAAMLARAEPRRRLKALYLTLAALIVAAVGVSRVYLGVHWPSDVLAGWALGTAWALLCYSVAQGLDEAGRIEPEREGNS